MSEQLLQRLDPNRRDFVKRLIAAGAAAPVVATFSIEALSQQTCVTSLYPGGAGSNSSASAGASLVGSFYCACQADLGYSGPGRFAAHLAYSCNASDFGARANGEMVLTVDPGNGDGDHDHDDHHSHSRSIRVDTDLVPGMVFSSGQIAINGVSAINLPSANCTVDDTNVLPGSCDLDYVLNAMASGQAQALVLVTYLGNPLVLLGPIAAAGPGFDFINLRS